MGINARLLIKKRGKPLSPREVGGLSAELCERIGRDQFLIGDPQQAVSIIEPFRDEFGDAPELAGKVVYFQDGPDIVAQVGEQFLEVHMQSRYYGPGYERGDWPAIKRTAEVIESLLPEIEIWYGGGSSGRCAELFDAAARERIQGLWLDATLGK